MSDADRVNGDIAAHLQLVNAMRIVAVVEVDEMVTVHIYLHQGLRIMARITENGPRYFVRRQVRW